jgi:hypothetical protein
MRILKLHLEYGFTTSVELVATAKWSANKCLLLLFREYEHCRQIMDPLTLIMIRFELARVYTKHFILCSFLFSKYDHNNHFVRWRAIIISNKMADLLTGTYILTVLIQAVDAVCNWRLFIKINRYIQNKR